MTALDITLQRGFPVRRCYVGSPFVNKLEARLRMGGVSYRVGDGSVLKGPRRKIPYVEVTKLGSEGRNAADSDGPETLTDSTLIARRLIDEGHMKDLNAKLSPAERAKDLAVRALLEDKLYFYQVCLSPTNIAASTSASSALLLRLLLPSFPQI